MQIYILSYHILQPFCWDIVIYLSDVSFYKTRCFCFDGLGLEVTLGCTHCQSLIFERKLNRFSVKNVISTMFSTNILHIVDEKYIETSLSSNA